jgi:hypothetical protein
LNFDRVVGNQMTHLNELFKRMQRKGLTRSHWTSSTRPSMTPGDP